jgi:hypothetical protein
MTCDIIPNMLQAFGLISGFLMLFSTLPYTRDILRLKTKPHRGSFLIWVVLGSIAFFSQFANGATWSLLLPATDTLATFSIFILSLRYGIGGLNKRDGGGLLLAGFGLIIWYFTKQPLAALLITIGIDAVGTVLTVLKAYDEPHTETFSSWLLASLGGLFAAFAAGKLSFALLVYPLYIFVANGAVDGAILLGKKEPATDKP